MTRSRLAASGAAALLSLALAACGGSGSGTAAPTTAPASSAAAPASSAAAPASSAATGAVCEAAGGPGEVAANAKGFAFDPATVSVNVGQSVTWTNGDSAPHSIVLDDGGCQSENFAGGATTTLKFNVAGSYPFHCGIHATMTGTIEVKA